MINRRSLLGALLTPLYCWLYLGKVLALPNIGLPNHEPTDKSIKLAALKKVVELTNENIKLKKTLMEQAHYITDLQNDFDKLSVERDILMYEIPYGWQRVERSIRWAMGANEDYDGKVIVSLYERLY